MINTIFQKRIAIIIYISITAIIGSMSVTCTKEVKKHIINTNRNSLQINNDSTMEYQKEGFISMDIYRIIIVEPKDDMNNRISPIEDIAKRRAISSLRHYLMANNKIIDRNVKAGIINMVNQYGMLKKVDVDHKTRNLYYFDIKKDDIKHFVDNLAGKR